MRSTNENTQGPGGMIQGSPGWTLSHPCTQPTISSQLYTRQLQHPREGGPRPNQDHKGSNLPQGKHPTLNRNIDKFNLNHIWNRVLLNTPVLKISPPQVYVHIHNNRHNQSIPTNGYLQVNIGHSGHALNSEHAYRGSLHQYK